MSEGTGGVGQTDSNVMAAEQSDIVLSTNDSEDVECMDVGLAIEQTGTAPLTNDDGEIVSSDEALVHAAIDKAIISVQHRERNPSLTGDEASFPNDAGAAYNALYQDYSPADDKQSSENTSTVHDSTPGNEIGNIPAADGREEIHSNTENLPDKSDEAMSAPAVHEESEADPSPTTSEKLGARSKQSAREAAPGLFLPPSVGDLTVDESDLCDGVHKSAISESTRSLFLDDDDQDSDQDDDSGNASQGEDGAEQAQADAEDEFYNDPLMGRVKRPVHLDGDTVLDIATSEAEKDIHLCDLSKSTSLETTIETMSSANLDNVKVQPVRAARTRSKSETMNDMFSGEILGDAEPEAPKSSLFNDSDSAEHSPESSPPASPTTAVLFENSEGGVTAQIDARNAFEHTDIAHNVHHFPEAGAEKVDEGFGDHGEVCRASVRADADNSAEPPTGHKDESIEATSPLFRVAEHDEALSFRDSIDQNARDGRESLSAIKRPTSNPNTVEINTSSEDDGQSADGSDKFRDCSTILRSDRNENESAADFTSHGTKLDTSVHSSTSIEDGSKNSNDNSLYASARTSISSAGVPVGSTTTDTDQTADCEKRARDLVSGEGELLFTDKSPAEASIKPNEHPSKRTERKKVFSFSVDDNSDEDLFAAEPVVHKPRKPKSPIKPVQKPPVQVTSPSSPAPLEAADSEEPEEVSKPGGLFDSDSDGDAEDSDLFTPISNSRPKIVPRSPALWRATAQATSDGAEVNEASPKLAEQSPSDDVQQARDEPITKETDSDVSCIDAEGKEISDREPSTDSTIETSATDGDRVVDGDSTLGDDQAVGDANSNKGIVSGNSDEQLKDASGSANTEETVSEYQSVDDNQEESTPTEHELGNPTESDIGSSISKASENSCETLGSGIPTETSPELSDTTLNTRSPSPKLNIGRMPSANSGAGPRSDTINLFDDDSPDEGDDAEKHCTRSKSKSMASGLYNDEVESDEKDGLFGPSSASKLVSREGNGGSLFGGQKKLKTKSSLFGAEKVRKKGNLNRGSGGNVLDEDEGDDFFVVSSVKKPPARERFVSLNPLGVGTKKYDPTVAAADTNSASKSRGSRSRNKESVPSSKESKIANMFAPVQQSSSQVESKVANTKDMRTEPGVDTARSTTKAGSTSKSSREASRSPKQSATIKSASSGHADALPNRQTRSPTSGHRIASSSRSAASLGLFADTPNTISRKPKQTVSPKCSPLATGDKIISNSAGSADGLFETPSASFASSSSRKKAPQSLFGDTGKDGDGFDVFTQANNKESKRDQGKQRRVKSIAGGMFGDSADELGDGATRKAEGDMFSENTQRIKSKSTKRSSGQGLFDEMKADDTVGEDSKSDSDDLFGTSSNATRKAAHPSRRSGWETMKKPAASSERNTPSKKSGSMFSSDEMEPEENPTARKSGKHVSSRQQRTTDAGVHTETPGSGKTHGTDTGTQAEKLPAVVVVSDGVSSQNEGDEIHHKSKESTIRSEYNSTAEDSSVQSPKPVTQKDDKATRPLATQDSFTGSNEIGASPVIVAGSIDKNVRSSPSSMGSSEISSHSSQADHNMGAAADHTPEGDAEAGSVAKSAIASRSPPCINVSNQSASARSVIQEAEIETSGKETHQRPSAKKSISSGLFGDEESDDEDGFGVSAVKSAIPKKSAMLESMLKSTSNSSKSKGLFDGDDDLFSGGTDRKIEGDLKRGVKKEKRISTKPRQANNSLFDLDETQTGDQFVVSKAGASYKSSKARARKKTGDVQTTLTWGGSDSESDAKSSYQTQIKASKNGGEKAGSSLFGNDSDEIDDSEEFGILKAFERRSPKAPATKQTTQRSPTPSRTIIASNVPTSDTSEATITAAKFEQPQRQVSTPPSDVEEPKQRDKSTPATQDVQIRGSPELPTPLPLAASVISSLSATHSTDHSPPKSESIPVLRTPNATPPPIIEKKTTESKSYKTAIAESMGIGHTERPSDVGLPSIQTPPVDDTMLEVNLITHTDDIFKECPPPLCASPPPVPEEDTMRETNTKLNPIESTTMDGTKESFIAHQSDLLNPIDDTILEVNYDTHTEDIFKECPPPLPAFDANDAISDPDLDNDRHGYAASPKINPPTLSASKATDANNNVPDPTEALEVSGLDLPPPLPELDTETVTPPLLDSTSFDGVFKMAPPPLEHSANSSFSPPPAGKSSSDGLDRDIPVPPPLDDVKVGSNRRTNNVPRNLPHAENGSVTPNPVDDRDYFLAGLNSQEDSVFDNDFSQNQVPQNATTKTYANIFTSVDGNSDIF